MRMTFRQGLRDALQSTQGLWFKLMLGTYLVFGPLESALVPERPRTPDKPGIVHKVDMHTNRLTTMSLYGQQKSYDSLKTLTDRIMESSEYTIASASYKQTQELYEQKTQDYRKGLMNFMFVALPILSLMQLYYMREHQRLKEKKGAIN